MKSRPVHVYQFEIEKYRYPELWFRVKCSKGTYIRSLANDLGIALGTGAYLGSLTRTASGPFKLKDAWNFRDLDFLMKGAKPLEQMLHNPE